MGSISVGAFVCGAVGGVATAGDVRTDAEAGVTPAVKAGCWFTDGTGGAGEPGTKLGFVGNIDGIMPPIDEAIPGIIPAITICC